jgi:hypothetical protein
MCDHIQEQTSRYDHEAKVLTLLLVCPACEIEQVVETLPYEPRFKPFAMPGPKRLTLVPTAATDSLPLAA